MKSQGSDIFPLPLSALLLKLEAANLPVDPARAMRLRRVLEQEGKAYLGRLSDLKFLIAPFIARNAKEQAEVYRIWEEFVHEYEEEWTNWGREPVKEAAVIEPTAWHYRYRRWILAAILLPILSGLIFAFWKGKVEPPVPPTPNEVTIGSISEQRLRQDREIVIENATPEPLNRQDSLSFTWRVIDVTSGRTLYDKNDFDFRWSVRGAVGQQLHIELSSTSSRFSEPYQQDALNLSIYCSDPPDLDGVTIIEEPQEPGDFFQAQLMDAKVEPEVTYSWRLDDTIIAEGPSLRYPLSEPGSYLFELQAIRGQDSVYCSSSWQHEVQVQESGKPFLAYLPLQRDTPHRYLQVADWVWGIAMFPALCSLFFWNRWRRRRHRKKTDGEEDLEALAAAYPVFETGPYYIPYQDQEAKINVPADFFRIADQLRLREAGGRTVFDSAASVSATVQGGGYPSWRETAIHKPAEYLLLLPYTHEFEQRECLLRRLGDFLAEHEAAITTYYHRGDFRQFWNHDHPDGWGAARLLSRYQDFRLIILGTGHGLVDPYETQQPRLLPDLAKIFHRWPRRLLLTTEAVIDWSWQERLLYEHFLLYPADTKGLRKGAIALNQVEEYEPGQFDKWTTELRQHRSERSGRYRTWSEVADHREYLSDDPPLFRWLCGLAVAAQPDFRLTIAIGRALGIEVTHNRLLRLSRIPWLASNRPDPQLRLALIDELSAEDQQAAREATLAELEAVATQVDGSFAQTEWITNKAVQQFSLEPAKPAYKQQIRDLRQLGLFSGGQLQELEHGLQRGGPSTTSATELPQLDKWLDTPEPQPWFTTDLVWGLLLCLIALIGSLACWDYNQTIREYKGGELPAWQQTAEVDDEALSKNNTAVLLGESLGREESYQEFIKNQEFWGRAARQLAEALDLRESNYPLADSNRYALEYNRRAKYLNFYLADSTDFPQGLIDAEGGLLLREFEGDLYDFTGDRESTWSLDYAHAIGLMCFYLSTTAEEIAMDSLALTGEDLYMLRTTAEEYYYQLKQARDSSFFDSLAVTIPVNLETVLLPYLLADPSISGYIGDTTREQGSATAIDTTNFDVDAPNPDFVYLNDCPRSDCGSSSLNFSSSRAGSYVCENELVTYYLDPSTIAYFDYFLIDWGDGTVDSILSSAISFFGEVGHDYRLEVITPGYPGQLCQGNIKGVKQCENGLSCNSQSFELIIVEPAEYADFSASTTRGCAPLEVQFTSKTTGAYLSEWYFTSDFSEPFSTEQNPVYTFSAPGTYELMQVVTTCGQSRPQTVEIVVLDPNSSDCDGTVTSDTIPRTTNAIRPQMVNVPGGTFTMGDTLGGGTDDELPTHEVTLSAFQMGRYEVTFDEYDRFCEDTSKEKPADQGWGRGRRPVVNVSWFDAVSYCNWLSRKEGREAVYQLADPAAQTAWYASNFSSNIDDEEVRRVNTNGYRLPTEAEWEYVASYTGEAGRKSRFGNGRDTARWEEMNFDASLATDYSIAGEYRGRTTSVGELGTAHPLGLHDLAGNVFEWCGDWFGPYSSAAQRNPTGAESARDRVMRGGSWYNDAGVCRSAFRLGLDPTYRYHFLGFRLVLVPGSG